MHEGPGATQNGGAAHPSPYPALCMGVFFCTCFFLFIYCPCFIFILFFLDYCYSDNTLYPPHNNGPFHLANGNFFFVYLNLNLSIQRLTLAVTTMSPMPHINKTTTVTTTTSDTHFLTSPPNNAKLPPPANVKNGRHRFFFSFHYFILLRVLFELFTMKTDASGVVPALGKCFFFL